MHPSVQAAVRAYLPPADLEQAVLAAADALMQTWPEAGEGTQPDQAELQQALRDCASTLRAAEGQSAQTHQSALWKPEAHPLLFREGLSLKDSGLAESAITYWQAMLITSTRLLGNAHVDAVTSRDKLAAAYEAAGRFGEAIAAFQNALASREHNQVPSTRRPSRRAGGWPTPTRVPADRPRRSRFVSKSSRPSTASSASGIRLR